MWLDASILVIAGVLVVWLTSRPQVRAWQLRRWERQLAGPATVPRAVAGDRIRRRSVGAGTGLVVGGLLVAIAYLLTRGSGGGIVVAGVGYAAAASGMAVVEIWRPAVLELGSPRTARLTVPRLVDYLPRLVTVSTWLIVGLAVVAAAVALVLTRSPWFAADVILDGPAPVLGAGLAILGVLTVLAVRRVLEAPEPARDDAELYWQDAVRASTLSTLHAPVAIIGALGVPLVARSLDDAASVVAIQQGVVGPDWITALLIFMYSYTVLTVVVLLAATLRPGQQNEMHRFRSRLWGGRVPGGVAA